MPPLDDECSWVFPDQQTKEGHEEDDDDDELEHEHDEESSDENDADESENDCDGEADGASSEEVSLTDEQNYSSFLKKDDARGNVGIGDLFGDSEDESVSLFLDSVCSSTHLQASDDEENLFLERFPDEPNPYWNKRVMFSWQTQQEPSSYHQNRVVGGRIARILGLPGHSLLAVSPNDFGDSAKFPHDDENGQIDTLESFQDEPVPSDHVRSVVSSEKRSQVEALPEDEYDLSSEEKGKPLPNTVKYFFAQKTGKRLGLGCVLLGFLILVVTGIIIGVTSGTTLVKPRLTQSGLTAQPSLSTTRFPSSNGSFAPGTETPTLSLLPVGPTTVFVPVIKDGYINLGGMILRDIEVQHTSTLLVQEGYHLTAAVSIIEFDTATTLAPPSVITKWITNATIRLTVAGHANVEVGETISLCARLYPNNGTIQPNGDIDEYGFGEIDFEDGWIPFEVEPYQTTTVDIDATTFFLEQYYPTREPEDIWDNIKLLLVHNNADGIEDKGAMVKFHSSEAVSEEDRPQLIVKLEPPDFTKSPAPSMSSMPSVMPTMSFVPSMSLRPSTYPSTSPSLRPSSSWGPTYNPTISPAPTITSYPICRVCGALQFGNPHAIVTNLGDYGDFGLEADSESISCGILRESGLNGDIPPKRCRQLQSKVSETCCLPPIDDVFICNLCGGPNDVVANVVNLDEVVSAPELGENRTCGEYQDLASAGDIPPLECGSLWPFTARFCCNIML